VRQPKIGIVALIINNGQVLMAERLAGKCQGKYAGPGGHLEWMETFVDGALRELREETGIVGDPASCEVIGVDQGFVPEEDHCWVVVFVRVGFWSGLPRQVESDKQGPWGWHPLDNLPDNTLEPLKRICKKLSELDG